MNAWQFLAVLPLPMWGKPPAACDTFRHPTPKQTGRKGQAIRLLMRQGFITLREISDMGDNTPSKTIWRMRRDGVLKLDATDPSGFRDVPNRDGKGTHRRYLWTRHRPAGWPEPKRTEKRGNVRGGTR